MDDTSGAEVRLVVVDGLVVLMDGIHNVLAEVVMVIDTEDGIVMVEDDTGDDPERDGQLAGVIEVVVPAIVLRPDLLRLYPDRVL